MYKSTRNEPKNSEVFWPRRKTFSCFHINGHPREKENDEEMGKEPQREIKPEQSSISFINIIICIIFWFNVYIMRRVVPKTNILWVLVILFVGLDRDVVVVVFSLLFFMEYLVSSECVLCAEAQLVADIHHALAPALHLLALLSDCLYILVWFRGGGQWSYCHRQNGILRRRCWIWTELVRLCCS